MPPSRFRPIARRNSIAQLLESARTGHRWSPPPPEKLYIARRMNWPDVADALAENPYALPGLLTVERRGDQFDEPGILLAKDFLLAWSRLSPSPFLARAHRDRAHDRPRRVGRRSRPPQRRRPPGCRKNARPQLGDLPQLARRPPARAGDRLDALPKPRIPVECHAMALALVVTLEKDLPDAAAADAAAYTKAASGRALARELDKLDFAARCKGVAQPSSMLSESQAALIEQLKADGFDPAKMRLPAEHFYPAGDGLKVIRALHEYVSEKLNDFKQPNPILRDLKAAEALLVAADGAGVRFHFTKTVL